ncbi:related to DNF1 - protein transporter [Melanopsichium pennsylvanicum]|uniref:Phospholipid-transporting ATPase n=2 Tax=Melanopsichium pennsylvanicum TaxID=63383 RepID=A0AAJ4XML6_9BASI|nr:related to DNF2-Non-essential P-type ATPase [Melanopsichium pennsylvanicum 4]SNX84933.1 related to DNF1 - protein transporter [Melanopsichium pennsylvanicum]
MFGKGASKSKSGSSKPKANNVTTEKFTALRAKFANFSLDPETVFKKERPPPAPRSVYFNEPLPEQAFDHKGKPQYPYVFASNQVLTAKYTIYNFVFKNLLEQFRRVANLFFLLIVILQFFPQFTTINPGVSMLPLLAVLAITMVKDGYEDIKRHQTDRHINRLKIKTLTGGGWQNPNVMEVKARSVSALLDSIKNKLFGGKQRQSSKLQKQMEAKAKLAAQEGQLHTNASAIQPPADAPGGGASNALHGNVPVPGEADLPVLASHPLARRITTRHSQLEPEYEQLDDGRIMHEGRILTAAEEHEFFAKKAPRWKNKNWEDLSVGDFVYLTNNESIPADLIICATSEEEDTCFIETKNLDGETNLKARHAVPELTSLRTPEECARASLRIDAEPQDTNMYRLNASVVLNDRFDKDGKPLQCPVTLNQILLRGCNVRNTKWVVGVVVMTGWDTKIIANSGVTPSKRSMVEKQMNPMVYFSLVVLACVSVACAIADSRLEQYYFDRDAYWEFRAIYSDDNPRINGLVAFANSLITFQNIVPISLYISFEFVRLAQAYFIYDDYDIWYEKTNRRTTAKSWNLSDDLGQIEYIFSDKTGTLTQNVMIFRECAISGIIYHGESNSPHVGASDTTATDVPSAHSEKDDGSSADGSNRIASGSDQGYSAKVRVKPLNPDIPPFRDHSLFNALKEDSEHSRQLGNFFRCLALCHTVLVEELEEGTIEYQAQSPDEQALVQAAADAGFIFLGKERQTLRLLTPYSKEPEIYELLVVNEFSSARKRMSVILRRESDGQLLMLAKGADSIMFERARPGQDAIKADIDAALEEFANKGLRTLCLGGKALSSEFYDDWRHRFHQASVSIHEREERMEELASELERDFDLYGATAIEDKLQDGVPETIADLKRAGINVWVATGDKLETAIAIGYSTMLLTEDMNLVVVRGGEYGQPNSAYDQLRKAVIRFFGGPAVLKEMDHQPPGEESESRRSSFMSRRPSYHRNRRSSVSQVSLVGEDNGQRTGGFALVIDGTALGHALSEDFSKDLLLRISTQCKAVICCRVSPLQKALIVRLIKDGLGVMTLAIGDGANDVSMIQAAHVGVGIAGEEGLQAVNSSDYAIAQFRFLKRLVLVHGHWSYYRNSVMITNFFYKQFIQVGTLFWFQIYCAWSTTQAIDYVYILLWNALWTVAAVIFLGIFDRNINDKVLMQVPELYHQSRKRSYFGLKPFIIYFFDGIYQSVVLFFFWAYTYQTTTVRNDGYDTGLFEWSTGMAIASVLVANLFVGINARAWTWWIFVGVWAGTVVMFAFAPIYAAFTSTFSYGNNHYLYASIQFWVLGLLTFFLALLPRVLANCLRQSYYPTDVDILRYVDKKDNNHDFGTDPAIPHAHANGAVYSDVDGNRSHRSMTHHTFAPLVRAATSTSRLNAADDLTGAVSGGVLMHELRQTASRASSTHYDMLTGEERPNRGYTFSSDEPSRGRTGLGKKKSVKDRLLPDLFKKNFKKKDQQRTRLTMIDQEDEVAVEENLHRGGTPPAS